MDIAIIVLSIDPDQLKHATLANPDRHFSLPVNFLFQESLLYIFIPLRQNVLARISLHGLHMLIWVDTLPRGHYVGFLAGWLNLTYLQNVTFLNIEVR